jgi:hypothetical protein
VPSDGCVLAPDTKLLNSGIASCTLRVTPLEGQVTAASSTPIVPFDWSFAVQMHVVDFYLGLHTFTPRIWLPAVMIEIGP